MIKKECYNNYRLNLKIWIFFPSLIFKVLRSYQSMCIHDPKQKTHGT